MAKTYQVTQDGIGYMLVEVLQPGPASFIDAKHFAECMVRRLNAREKLSMKESLRQCIRQ